MQRTQEGEEQRQQQRQGQQQSLIRHSGSVAVRGKICRIWRPRFLELWDNGYVRYFDNNDEFAVLEDTNTPNNNGDNDNNDLDDYSTVVKQQPQFILPKSILYIHHARIIDVTTLRDIHIGLPRGTYGFCFHGQQVVIDENEEDDDDEYDNAPIAFDGHNNTENTSFEHFSFYSTSGNNNTGISPVSGTPAITTTTPTSITPSSYYYSCQGGGEKKKTVPQSRDYFCAVNTLEEAQMWVVALQWAARNKNNANTTTTTTTTTAVTTTNIQRQQPNLFKENHISNNNNKNSKAENKLSKKTTTMTTTKTITNKKKEESSSYSPKIKQQQQQQEQSNDDNGSKTNMILNKQETTKNHSSTTAAAAAAAASPKKKNANQRVATEEHHRNNTKNATTTTTRNSIVVGKVHHVTLVRTKILQWEYAFVIQYLLIQQTTTTTTRPTTTKNDNNNNNNNNNDDNHIQEFHILRTCRDMIRFLQTLEVELKQQQQQAQSSSSSSSFTRIQTFISESIHKFQNNVQHFDPNDKINTSDNTKNNSSNKDKNNVISIVNSMFIKCCMEATIVNSQSMKVFLGMGNNNNNNNPSSSHRSSSLLVSPKPNNDNTQTIWSAVRTLSTKVQNLGNYHDSTTLFHRQTLDMNNTNMDRFVKQWLQQKIPKEEDNLLFERIWIVSSLPTTKTTTAATTTADSSLRIQLLRGLVQHPKRTVFSGILSGGLLFGGATAMIEKHNMTTFIPVVTLRADRLFLSWMLSGLIGYYYASFGYHDMSNNNNTYNQENDVISRSKKASSRSTISSNNNYNAVSSQSSAATGKNAPTLNETNRSLMKNKPSIKPIITKINDHDGDDDTLSNSVLSTTTTSSSVLQDSTTAASSAAASTAATTTTTTNNSLFSPLPEYSKENNCSCWSKPEDSIFYVRGANYIHDKIKIRSDPSLFTCRGVDMLLSDNPQRHIARHPQIFGGNLFAAKEDIFLVNFLLPFGNFVSYFSIPPTTDDKKNNNNNAISNQEKLKEVWRKFINGDQQYRDKRLKLLPVVVDGPWIVKAAVGNGTSPALLGKVIPLQYYFSSSKEGKKYYEVDVIISASNIAKGILSVVKGHTKNLTIAFAFIIEGTCQEELPETVLCSLQVHSLHLEHCSELPDCNLDEME